MRGLAAVLSVLCACGRIGFDNQSTGGDAGSDAAPPAGRWLGVIAGGTSTCGIATDHTAWCWGFLQLPGSDPLHAPTQAFALTWSALALWSDTSTYDHACGIQTDGSLWCGGDNSFGELGDGTHNSAATPIQVGSATTWRAVGAGFGFSCGLQSDGSLWCWGRNPSGQLGVGSTMSEIDTPQRVAGTWTSLAVGFEYACGIQTGGTLWCWGENGSSQLGDNTTTDRNTPLQVPGTWLTVVTSNTHTCAIASDASTWCWGSNTHGELGTGDTAARGTPTSIGQQLVAIALGNNHSCGIDASHSLLCWGDATYGQLGLGGDTVTTPTRVPNIVATAVSAEGDQTCVIDDQQRLSCTGRNSFGQLGSDPGELHAPAQADTLTNWVSIAAGGTHACATNTDNQTQCWGLNSEGEVGDGSMIDRQAPVLSSAGAVFTKVVAGAHTTIGLKADTSAWLFGCDWVAQTNNSSDEQLAMTGWNAAAIGDEHTCGITGTSLYCRGDNTYGQLGDGTNTASANTQVAGSWSMVAAGLDTTCAINSSAAATLTCWGRSSSGQVGNGMTGNFSSPQAVAITVGTTTRIAVGDLFTCAIDGNGALWCWGDNSYAQLGDGGAGDQASPVQLGTRTDWRELALGSQHACAIPADGTLWCWGRADGGGTADEDSITAGTNTTTPRQIGTDTSWAHVAAGNGFTCALKTDGTRWCFGTDYDGQLGNGKAWRASFAYIP